MHGNGKFAKIKGSICNILIEKGNICNILPRPANLNGLIMVKLKWDLKHRGYAYFEPVRPNGRITKPATTDNRPPTHREVLHQPIDRQVLHQPTDHRQPTTNPPTGPPPTHRPLTTDHRPTDRSSTNPPTTVNQPSTHRQVLHQPTNHRQSTTNPSTGPPPTRRPPTTDHRPNDRLVCFILNPGFFSNWKYLKCRKQC